MQVYRQELLYGEREAKSPLEIALAEKLEARDMELYQQRSDSERKLTDLLDYYTLWVHQIKTPHCSQSTLSCRSSRPPTEAAIRTGNFQD